MPDRTAPYARDPARDPAPPLAGGVARRHLLGAALAAALSRAGLARGDGAPVRIGWLTAQRAASLTPYIAALRDGLAAEGLEEGRNLAIAFRYGDDDLGRVPALAGELAAAKVAALLVQGAAAPITAALRLPVPLVYVVSGDPVAAGLAESYARPGGGMTGVTLMAAEFNRKRLDLLREMIPGLRHVAIIGNPEHPGEQLERAVSLDAGSRLGLRIDYHATGTPEDLAAALARLAAAPPQALSVFADGFTLQNRQRIIEAAAGLRIPVISGWPSFAESGAVCTYGPRIAASYRRLASYIARILKGARPGDLPVERPDVFELVINLKAAQALGLTVPTAMLALADRIIE
ncbi:ABC transporter substrate-binding protein [Methylobacterium sp. WSM2598]|uniref:ABC transporter substrate-binding protein n=1 Tax=Methylobacterium sp. WSM2598 TaxID=398261 RepID=UPI0012F638A1|nr:ABC transporter substrate-binding protein [Methylobacterium sp. WSM2598]